MPAARCSLRPSRLIAAWRRLGALLLCWAAIFSPNLGAELPDTIDRVRPAIVIVGTYSRTASPQFSLRGTGFVVGDGNLAATNAHVIAATRGVTDGSTLAVQTAGPGGEPQVRPATIVGIDEEHDLAVIRFDGAALPHLRVRNSDSVREGQAVAFTGFPIGGALGFSPVTHRATVSAITPIALPGANAGNLNEKLIRRLRSGTFRIFQLDGTAYPGNSGGPLYEIDSGEVVGIINMVFVKGTKESVLSQPSGISYAIPSNFLLDLLKSRER
jgi:serine protease Do